MRSRAGPLPAGKLWRWPRSSARLGNWKWNLRTGEVGWSPEMYTLHGVTPDSPALTPETLVKQVYPDDLEKISMAISRAVSEGALADLEYRIVRPDGAIRVIHAMGEVTEFDGKGRPAVMLGTTQDITERKRAEELLKESRKQLEIFIDHAPAALAIFDREMHYLSARRDRRLSCQSHTVQKS